MTSNDVAKLVDMLSDANDIILERVGMNLDEASGRHFLISRIHP